MRRSGNLWGTVVSWPNLEQAAHSAAQGKRSRPAVAAFLLKLEPRLAALRRELRDGIDATS